MLSFLLPLDVVSWLSFLVQLEIFLVFDIRSYFFIDLDDGSQSFLQYSRLENPMDGGAWWAAVHGVARSRTRLSDFTLTYSLSCIGEGDDNPLQWSFLENPRDGGAWWAAVCGVAHSRTRLK